MNDWSLLLRLSSGALDWNKSRYICKGLLRDLLHSARYKEPYLNLQAVKQEKTELRLPFLKNSSTSCCHLYRKKEVKQLFVVYMWKHQVTVTFFKVQILHQSFNTCWWFSIN